MSDALAMSDKGRLPTRIGAPCLNHRQRLSPGAGDWETPPRSRLRQEGGHTVHRSHIFDPKIHQSENVDALSAACRCFLRGSIRLTIQIMTSGRSSGRNAATAKRWRWSSDITASNWSRQGKRFEKSRTIPPVCRWMPRYGTDGSIRSSQTTATDGWDLGTAGPRMQKTRRRQ